MAITREQFNQPGNKFRINSNYSGQNFKVGDILFKYSDDGSSNPYFYNESKTDFHAAYLTSVDVYNKTLESLTEGDIISDGDGSHRKVLFVLKPGLYAVSAEASTVNSHHFEKCQGIWTAFELREEGYVDPEEEVEELTVEEVSRRLGKTVKIVK